MLASSCCALKASFELLKMMCLRRIRKSPSYRRGNRANGLVPTFRMISMSGDKLPPNEKRRETGHSALGTFPEWVKVGRLELRHLPSFSEPVETDKSKTKH